MENLVIQNIYAELKNGKVNLLIRYIHKLCYKDPSDIISLISRLFESDINISRTEEIGLYIGFHLCIIRESFDNYCDILDHFKNTINKNRLKWILVSPVIKDGYDALFNCDDASKMTRIIAYLDLSMNLMIPIKESLVKKAVKLINYCPREFMNVIAFAIYHLGPPNVHYNGIKQLVYCKRKLMETIKLSNTDPIFINNIAFVFDNLNVDNSDYKGAKTFIDAARKILPISIIYQTGDRTNNGDNYYLIPLEDISKMNYRFPLVVYVTNSDIFSIILSTMRIGYTQVGILGQCITSGIPTIDYFIVPIWDNVKNYTEKSVIMSYMACSIPRLPIINREYATINNSKLIIGCPMTGAKINTMFIPVLHKIQSILNAKLLIHVGPRDNNLAIVRGLENIHLHSLEYTLYHNSKTDYYEMIHSSDIILCSFPYTPYISLLDILALGKLPVVLENNDRNSSQCAAQLLKIFGLPELIATSIDAYIELTIKLANMEYRSYILEKIKSIDYNAKIDIINSTLSDEFQQWVRKLNL